MADGIVNWGKSKKDRLTEELHRLENEIDAYGSAVSDSQVWHKRARIEQIKKELAQPEGVANQLNAGTDRLKEMMAAKEQAGMQLTPEQVVAAKGAGRE